LQREKPQTSIDVLLIALPLSRIEVSMSRPDLTDITLVLDRSGSMEEVKEATIQAFNQFLQSQRKADGSANMTLVQFDDQYEVLYEAKDIGQAWELNGGNYVPRASTALLDAMGRTILRTGQRLVAMNERDRPGTVLFVTLTDGLENASCEFDVTRINSMISEQRDKYSWQFLFLAANQDAIATASQMGIGAGQALTFDANDEGVRASMDIVDKKFAALRKGRIEGDVAAPIEFDAEDREMALSSKSKPKRKRRGTTK
jgi:hypothetical protein